jgi:drug/metabolite transporter (DMT)-like permease
MFFFGSFVFASLQRAAALDSGPAPTGGSWLPPLVYGLALAGGDACFILATHRIPAAQANLISYLWPVMIVVFGTVIGLFRLRPRQFIGLVLGFLGAVILIWDGRISMSLSGIALALLSGACWAAYCIFRLTWKKPASHVLAGGCALSTVLCLFLHFLFEPTVIPSFGALAATAVAGMIPLALGNFVWDVGFRRGDGQLLAVMAYATPLCSAILLAALGAALLTWNLLTGAVVIVVAGFLSRADAAVG